MAVLRGSAVSQNICLFCGLAFTSFVFDFAARVTTTGPRMKRKVATIAGRSPFTLEIIAIFSVLPSYRICVYVQFSLLFSCSCKTGSGLGPSGEKLAVRVFRIPPEICWQTRCKQLCNELQKWRPRWCHGFIKLSSMMVTFSQ